VRLLLLLLLLPCVALGQTSSLNLAVPTSPQSFQTDRFRAGDMDCSSAIGSATNVEFGVVGIVNEGNQFANTLMASTPADFYNNQVKDIGVYGKITIPIGAPKERLNCNILYQLELERRRLEIQKLRAEIASLRDLQFEN
jgi:hypothetical protein